MKVSLALLRQKIRVNLKKNQVLMVQLKVLRNLFIYLLKDRFLMVLSS